MLVSFNARGAKSSQKKHSKTCTKNLVKKSRKEQLYSTYVGTCITSDS